MKLRYLTVMLLMFAIQGVAQTFPELTTEREYSRVIDDANILDDDIISKKLLQWENDNKQTGVQIVVVTVSDLEGYEINDYTQRLGEYWGVGQDGSDNGIVMLVAPNDRAMSIQTGYGIEPFVTDAETSRIQNNKNIDEFKAGIYTPSVLNMIDALHKEIGTMTPEERAEWVRVEEITAARRREAAWNTFLDILSWIFVLVILGLIVFAIYSIINKRVEANREARRLKNLIKYESNLFKTKYATLTKYKQVNTLQLKIEDTTKSANKTFLWTSKIELNNSDVKKNIDFIVSSRKQISIKLQTRYEIDTTVSKIRDFFAAWMDYQEVREFIAYANEMDKLDLDDDLANVLIELQSQYNTIHTYISYKSTIINTVADIRKSQVVRTYIEHPGVKEFSDSLSDYEDAELNEYIGIVSQNLLNRKKELEADIRLRNEISEKTESFAKFEILKTVGLATIAELGLSDSLNIEFLNNAKASYATFDRIRNGGLDSINRNWNTMKCEWYNMQHELSRFVDNVRRYETIKSNYNNAIRDIPVLSATALSTIAQGKVDAMKEGVQNITKTKFESIVNAFSGLNTKDVTGTLNIITLFNRLSEITSGLSDTVMSMNNEHTEYLAELKEIVDRERRKKDNERRRRNSYSSSSSYRSSGSIFSSGSSGSSFGGGSFGGGGSSSSW